MSRPRGAGAAYSYALEEAELVGEGLLNRMHSSASMGFGGGEVGVPHRQREEVGAVAWSCGTGVHA